MKILLQAIIFFISIGTLQAQTVTDGLMMPKNNFCTGFMYSHDQWTNYWEGSVKRDNQNIGTITTQSLMWFGNYGITKKWNAIAMVPYVVTKANSGTLRGMAGVQDLTLAIKYNFFKTAFDSSAFKAFAVASYATPLTNYAPDYLPLSIGTASKRLSWRLTMNYALKQGIYANVSGGYTWRSNVYLDRPSHYYEGQLINSTEAYLPNVFDLFAAIGYHKKALQIELNLSQQSMWKGDDIRRQAMPEVGNRMNYSKLGGLVMYYVAKPRGLAVRGSYSYTIAGRNVGQSTTLMGGLMYTFQFFKNK